MINKISIFLYLLSIIFPATSWSNEIVYIHPLPNSKIVSIQSSIIVRFQDDITKEQVHFSVTGRHSGQHSGNKILSANKKTLIFKPHINFDSGETIFVVIDCSFLLKKFSFSFETSNYSLNSLTAENLTASSQIYSNLNNDVRIINGVSLPNDFPTFNALINNGSSEGKLFIANYDARYIMILNNDGSPYFYRKSDSRVWDFTIQPDGTMTYIEGATAKRCDAHFEVVNTYKCGNDYTTDHHEFRLLPNGNALLIAEDIQQIDMSKIVEGGYAKAQVIGNHIQEVDTARNVLFEWRCWDHYNITDAMHISLKSSKIHFVHINAIDVDYDGHYLISSRHLDEVTKINHITGEVIWRLGGKNNQFRFINDPDKFSYQHDIRALPGKPNHYTLMDNGNYHSPKYSRAVEYFLDTVNMTAEKVWEYRHIPDRYSDWMGNVQRLENGNTLIGWSHKYLPKITEVTSNGDIVYEGDFSLKQTCYRVHRFNCNTKAIRPYLLIDKTSYNQVTLLFNQFGDPDVMKYYIYADTEENPTTRIDSTVNPYIYLSNLRNNTLYYFRVTSVNHSGIESNFSNQQSYLVKFSDVGDNLILNGDFEQDFDFWQLFNWNGCISHYEIDIAGQCHIEIESGSTDPSDIQLIQENIELISGMAYTLEFDAYASINNLIEVKLCDYLEEIDYSRIGFFQLSSQPKHFAFKFIMEEETDIEAIIIFNLALSSGDIYIDNISLLQSNQSAVSETKTTISNYNLYPNYPNPFNAQTQIRYWLPYNGNVRLTFFNILGQAIQQYDVPDQIAGEHQFNFNSSQIESGIYFCQLLFRSQKKRVEYSNLIKLICLK